MYLRVSAPVAGAYPTTVGGGGFHTYMVLVREHDEAAGYAARLEDVEHGQPLGDGQPVVQLVVDDLSAAPCQQKCPRAQLSQEGGRGGKPHQHRGRPLVGEARRVPLVVHVAPIPECAAKVADGEEELLGGPLAAGGEGAVVAD